MYIPFIVIAFTSAFVQVTQTHSPYFFFGTGNENDLLCQYEIENGVDRTLRTERERENEISNRAHYNHGINLK